MTLTADQLQALAAGRDIRFSQGGVELVVISAEKYGELKEHTNLDQDELRLILARSSKENGWDEPGMEAYDAYPEKP